MFKFSPRSLGAFSVVDTGTWQAQRTGHWASCFIFKSCKLVEAMLTTFCIYFVLLICINSMYISQQRLCLAVWSKPHWYCLSLPIFFFFSSTARTADSVYCTITLSTDTCIPCCCIILPSVDTCIPYCCIILYVSSSSVDTCIPCCCILSLL